MRHRLKDNHLGRTDSHRRAMLSNMASSLLIHKRIRTTEAKAKALRRYVEPLLTKSKNDTTHSRRTVFSYLQNKYAVKELFTAIAPEIMDRPGGYTRILKLGRRYGDGAEVVLMELVDFNEFLEGKPLAKTTNRKKPKKKTVTPPTAKKEIAVQDVTSTPEQFATAESQAEKTEASVEAEAEQTGLNDVNSEKAE